MFAKTTFFWSKKEKPNSLAEKFSSFLRKVEGFISHKDETKKNIIQKYLSN